tara:strand:+ start:3993 stop:4796 length:804 start_codon:yes stop_codon:yes gene_type:complete
METLRLLGEWLITPLTDIQVIDFQCWRRNSAARRRTFEPFIHLKVGQHDIVIDGYDSVWSFLDTIQPDMYRSMVNAAMKGDIEDVIFARELVDLIEESEIDMLTIQYETKRMRVPNDIRVIEDCYIAKDFRATPVETQVSDKYQRLDFIVKIDTPYRDTHGLHYVPTYVYGSYPQLVLVREYQEGLLTTCIVYNPTGKDIRLCRKNYWSPDDTAFFLNNYLPEMARSVNETEYARLEGDNQNAIGMLSRERDDIEVGRLSQINYLEV